MRLWHYKLIPFLPDSQLRGQWRELNSIFKDQPNHILINYCYGQISALDILHYTFIVIAEYKKRNFKIKKLDNFKKFFPRYERIDDFNFFKCASVVYNKIEKSVNQNYVDGSFFERLTIFHNNRYLRQCFYNLQEKYDRGQKDFSKEQYEKLKEFCIKELNDGSIKDERGIKMKEIDYTNRNYRVIEEGDYEGRHYVITFAGSHPCAYAEFKFDCGSETKEYENIPCHVGVTYEGFAFWNKEDKRHYIGWDYGHVGDYESYYTKKDNLLCDYKKWSTEEIYEEVKKVIEYLNNIATKKNPTKSTRTQVIKEKALLSLNDLQTLEDNIKNLIKYNDENDIETSQYFYYYENLVGETIRELNELAERLKKEIESK